jgi:hypothetical protein
VMAGSFCAQMTGPRPRWVSHREQRRNPISPGSTTPGPTISRATDRRCCSPKEALPKERTKPSTCAGPTALPPCVWETELPRRYRRIRSGSSRCGTEDSCSFRRARVNRGRSRHQGSRCRGASWFPDGERILFFAVARGQRTRVYVTELAGTPRPITPEGFFGWHVSPDGRFFVARADNRGAFLFAVDGGEPRPLRGMPSRVMIAGFDAAGPGVFLASRGLPLKIVRYDIASGRLDPWKDIQVSDPAGVVQLNNIVLTADGKSYAYTFFRMLSRLYVVHGLK